VSGFVQPRLGAARHEVKTFFRDTLSHPETLELIKIWSKLTNFYVKIVNYQKPSCLENLAPMRLVLWETRWKHL